LFAGNVHVLLRSFMADETQFDGNTWSGLGVGGNAVVEWLEGQAWNNQLNGVTVFGNGTLRMVGVTLGNNGVAGVATAKAAMELRDQATLTAEGGTWNDVAGPGLMLNANFQGTATLQGTYIIAFGVPTVPAEGILAAGGGTLNLQGVHVAGHTNGLDVTGDSAVTVSAGTEISNNSAYGIRVAGSGVNPVILDGALLRYNGAAGLFLVQGSTRTVEARAGCAISWNAMGLVAWGGTLSVFNAQVEGNSGNGVWAAGTADVTLQDTNVNNNGTTMPAADGHGVFVASDGKVTLRNTYVTDNFRAGIRTAANSTQALRLEGGSSSRNGRAGDENSAGLAAAGSGPVLIFGTDFDANYIGVNLTGTGFVTVDTTESGTAARFRNSTWEGIKLQIANSQRSLTFNRMEVSGNHKDGFYIGGTGTSETISISNSVFSGNSVLYGATGGLHVGGDSSITVEVTATTFGQNNHDGVRVANPQANVRLGNGPLCANPLDPRCEASRITFLANDLAWTAATPDHGAADIHDVRPYRSGNPSIHVWNGVFDITGQLGRSTQYGRSMSSAPVEVLQLQGPNRFALRMADGRNGVYHH